MVIIYILQLLQSLTPWDILLSLIAAATHDLDHPGVNQPFLIKTNHYLATLYKVSRTLILLSFNGIWLAVIDQEKNLEVIVHSLRKMSNQLAAIKKRQSLFGIIRKGAENRPTDIMLTLKIIFRLHLFCIILVIRDRILYSFDHCILRKDAKRSNQNS